MENFEEIVERLRNVGDMLVPYNYPLNDPRLEDDIHLFKLAEAVVDGYDVIVYFSRADYKTHFLETLQVYGKNIPFLPFSIVTKVARKFLGGHCLSLVELPASNRKLYCWTVCLDRRGRPIKSPYDGKVEVCVYEGFKFSHMQPDQVNLI